MIQPGEMVVPPEHERFPVAYWLGAWAAYHGHSDEPRFEIGRMRSSHEREAAFRAGHAAYRALMKGAACLSK